MVEGGSLTGKYCANSDQVLCKDTELHDRAVRAHKVRSLLKALHAGDIANGHDAGRLASGSHRAG